MKTKDAIKWLWKMSQGMRFSILMNMFTGLIGVFTSLAFVWIVKKLVDVATESVENSLSQYVCLMVGCMALQIVFSVVSSRLEILNSTRMKNTLRQRLFTRLMESHWSGRERYHTGDMLNRLEEDVRVVSDTMCSSVPNIVVTSIQLVAAFGFLLILQAKMAWIIVIIMPIALVLSKVYMQRMRQLTKNIRDTDSCVQEHLQEHLQHRTLIRSMEQTKNSTGELASLQESLMQQVVKQTDFSLFSRTAVHCGFAAGYAVAFLWGIYGLQSGTVTFGIMMAFLQLVIQVQRPAVELGRQVPGFVRTLTSAERLAELDMLEQEEKGDPIFLNGTPGVSLQNLTFSYPDSERQIIQDFSYDFKPGSFTALVGETGVGKSTLIRLMLALLKPANGKVLLYDNDKRVEASPKTRCNFVYVPQGNTLMSGTIRENLLLGNPNASDDELNEALFFAAADFVNNLPNGLNTLCGEGGAGLSEGQAQRISIARALLRKGGVLLLDEPTSALDSDTESKLMERLMSVASGKTVIVITHRDTLVSGVDIVALKSKEYGKNYNAPNLTGT